jgi:large subunit ribosomal protein L35
MPKMKTSSAAKKRFKITAAGKVLRRPAFRTHLLEGKTAKRKRHKRGTREVPSQDVREVKRLLGRR